MKRRKRRKINPRLVKIHRSYTVHDAARRLNVGRRTVWRWIKAGMKCCDDQRPYLIRGQDMRDFLQSRQTARRRTCQPGQIYCVACREPVTPWGNMVDYLPRTEVAGDLVGLCPQCERQIFRRVNVARMSEIRGDLEVTIPKAGARIGDTSVLSVSVHLPLGDTRHQLARLSERDRPSEEQGSSMRRTLRECPLPSNRKGEPS